MTYLIEQETFISLHDTDDWNEFWAANGEAIQESDERLDENTCFALACNCCLIIGGGAAPEFRVGFVD